MYIRFAQFQRDPEARVAPGLFQAIDRLPKTHGQDWRRDEITRLGTWFDDHLERPDVLAGRIGRHRRRGVCWFLDHATRHIDQARYLAWLLSDLGIAIRELRAEDPGHPIWQDDAQAVIIPDRQARVQFA